MPDTETLPDWQSPGMLAQNTPPPVKVPDSNPFDEFDATPSAPRVTPDVTLRSPDASSTKNPFDEFDVKNDPLDFTDKFNTKLSSDQEKQFQSWKSQYAPNDSGYDYDLRGAFLSGVKPDPERGHFPDTFKKPNHPTFSDQSQYNGISDGNGGTYQGGKWGDNDSFTSGPTNFQMHGKDDLQNYFKKYEPNSQLIFGTDSSEQIQPLASINPAIRPPDISRPSANPFDAFDASTPLQEPKPVEGTVSIGAIKYDPFAYLIPGGPARAQSAINAANQAGFSALGNAVEWGGGLLRQFGNANWLQPWASNQDAPVDPNTDPYHQAGLKIKQYAANYVTDPKFSGTNTVGNVVGGILPATAAGPLAPFVGGTMLGSQTYDQALASGASENAASAISLPAAALGTVSPLGRILKPSGAVASATWGQLFKNAAIGAGIAGGRNLVEMSGINAATNEMSNAVASPDSQQSQGALLLKSITDAIPMALVGSVIHVGEQGTAEYNVNQIAKQQGMAKSELIGNTATFYQNLATNDALSPQQKMAASTEYLSQFSPHAAQTLVAHVQNVGQAVDSIKAAIAASKEIAPTNPQTAEALQTEQTNQAISRAQENAKTIEQQADDTEKALPPELTPDEPQKTQDESAPAEPVAEQEAEPTPIEGAMPDDEYKATQSKLASSDDADVSARAKQLADERKAILDEHASTDSDARKADLEKQLLANDDALRNLEQEPVAPKQETPTVEPPKPREVTGYDEYGNPVYAEEPVKEPTETSNVETQTASGPTPTVIPEARPAEEKGVEPTVPTEQGSAEKVESPAPVAEQPTAEVRQPEAAQDISKLKRPQLEKIAADEGHSPEDIKSAKGVKELRDLIDAKRIVKEAPTNRDTGLVQDGKAQVDPKISRLASKYADPIKAFVKAAKAYGLRGVTKFLVGDESHDAAFYADPRSGHFDTVYINPTKVAKEMAYLKAKGLSPTEINHYLKTVFREEFIHAQVGNILSKRWAEAGKPGSFEQYYDKNYQAIYDKMSKAEKKETVEDYGGGLNHPVNIGEEFLRKTVQLALGGEATEALNAKVRSRVKTNKPLRNLLQDLTDRFKGISQKLVGLGKPDTELDVITNKLESLLGERNASNVRDLENGTRATEETPKGASGAEADVSRSVKNSGSEVANDKSQGDNITYGNRNVASAPRAVPYEDEEMPGKFLPSKEGGGIYVSSNGESHKVDEDGRFNTNEGKEYALDDDGAAQPVKGQDATSADEDKYSAISRPILSAGMDAAAERHVINSKETGGDYDQMRKRMYGPLSSVAEARKTIEPLVKTLSDEDLLFAAKSTDELGKKATKASRGKQEKAVSESLTKTVANMADVWMDKNYGKPDVAGASKLQPSEDDEHDLYFGGNEGLKERAPYVPSKSEEEASKLKPFVESGEGGELKPTGDERLRSERLVSEQGQEKEKTLANRIDSLKDIEVPAEDQVRFKTMAENQSKFQFSNEANRDIAEGNAFVKAIIESKKWIEKNGSLEGFGARRVIQNSLLDDARRLSKGESIVSTSEDTEKAPVANEEGEEPEIKPKGYDPTEQDYDAQQSQFEPVGGEGSIPSHLETPAKKVQDAIVEKNIKDVTSSFSPYGRRLLELWADTPDQEGSAFPAWVSAAAKEFGVSRAKIMADKDAIDNKVRQEVEARGLTLDDFRRVAGAPKLRPPDEREHGLTSQVTNDERLRDDVRSLMSDKFYTKKSNQQSNQEASDVIAKDGEGAAYANALSKIFTGKPTSVDAAVFQKINQKMLSSEDAGIRYQGIQDGTMVAVELTKAGQFTQAFRMWSKLGADGALLAYDKMIRPVIDKSKDPFKATTDAIENAVKEGKQQAIDQTIERMAQNGVFEKAEKIAAQNKEDEKPVWQRYMERTAEAISRTVGDTSSPIIKGALQEFSQRMQNNLKALIAEKVKIPTPKKVAPMSADAKIREIYNNEPEYREAWEYAKTYIDAKYAEHPEILEQYQKALDSALAIPVKLLDKSLADSMKASGIKISDLAKEWAGKQNITKNQLIDDLKMRIGLNGDQAKALGDAIASRFHQKLAEAKKSELTKLIKGSGNNRLASEAPSIADKILKAVNLGVSDDRAAWDALADKLKLPKYNDAVAADLTKRANEIQKMIAAGKEGKLTDDKTQEMLDVLADEAQKSMSKWKQFGQGMMSIFYGNIFGPLTVARKTVSEVTNLISEVGTRAAVEMRHGDAMAIPRAYAGALRGLYQRGGADFRSILATGKGARQGHGGDYTSNNLAERGKIFGNIPGLSLLNKPTSLYKYVGRALYGAQAFFYAGSAEARATMVSYRIAKQLIKEGRNPDELTVNQLTNKILGNTPEMRAQYAKQAQEEGLTGRDAGMRIQELAEGQRPEDARIAAHDFASRATFMQEPEGVLGAMYKGLSSVQAKHPWTRLFVPVARVVSNVFNNFLSYTPAGTFGAIRLARGGDTDAALQQGAKMIVGGLSMTAFMSLFGPNVQGSGPPDYNKRKQLMNPQTGNGWIPYSIKLGNNYYSYREWPTALMMAGLGNYYDQQKYGQTAPDIEQRLAVAMTGTGRFALTSSWISSVNNILQMFDSSSPEEFEKSFKNFAGQTGSALVPFNQKSIQMMDQIFDPSVYSPSTISGILLSRVPVAREMTGGKPSLNVFGEPIESNPIQSLAGIGTTNTFYSKFSATGTFIPAVTKTEHINGRAITTDELYQLTKDVGQATKDTLETVGLDAMSTMTPEESQDYVSRIYRSEVMRSKEEISANAPDAGHTIKSNRHHR